MDEGGTQLLELLPKKSAEKALWVLRNRRISHYVFKPSGRELWTVEGETREYIVLGDFYCSCFDFYMGSLTRATRPFCYHLTAKLIAEKSGEFNSYVLLDSEFDQIMEELLGFTRRPATP